MTRADVMAALFPDEDGPGTTVVVAEEVPVPGHPCTMTVRLGQCRWPLWPDGATPRQPGEQLYCGAPVDPSLESCSWCPEHRQRARRVGGVGPVYRTPGGSRLLLT